MEINSTYTAHDESFTHMHALIRLVLHYHLNTCTDYAYKLTCRTDQAGFGWSPYDQQSQTTPEAVGSSTHMIPNVSVMSYTGSHDLPLTLAPYKYCQVALFSEFAVVKLKK